MIAKIQNILNIPLIGLAGSVLIILSLGIPWATAEDSSHPAGIFPLMGRILSDGALGELSASVAFIAMSVVIVGAALHAVARFNGGTGTKSSFTILAACLVVALCPGVLEHVWIGWAVTVVVASLEPIKLVLSLLQEHRLLDRLSNAK